MASIRAYLLAGTAITLIAVQPAVAVPAEPTMVVTPMSDPDPNFVPPPPEKHPNSRRQSTATPTLDQAFEDFGRTIGQAAQVMRARGTEAQAHAAIAKAKADAAAARNAPEE